MQKPIITLKNLKYLASLSEETPAYTATICVNGKPFTEVSNSGHGGSDSYHGLKNTPPNAIWGDVKELDGLIAATYPRHEYDFGEGRTGGYEESLECLCHCLVYEEMEKKSFKSLLSRKIVMFNDKNQVTTVNGKKTDALLQAARKKWPEAIILNTLAFEEAFELYKQAI